MNLAVFQSAVYAVFLKAVLAVISCACFPLLFFLFAIRTRNLEWPGPEVGMYYTYSFEAFLADFIISMNMIIAASISSTDVMVGLLGIACCRAS